MASQLGASLDLSGGKGWQSNWLSSFDKTFLKVAVPAPVV